MNKYGLKKTKHDPRDYSHRKTFGAVLVTLPDEYIVGQTPVISQYGSMFCTAFASCVLAALEDGQQFSPEWFYAQEVANSGQTDGQDLRTPCKTAVSSGFLPRNKAQFSLPTQTPDFLQNPKNWPFSDELSAAPFKRQSYFNCTGDFEEIRQTIYQNKKAVLTGVEWQEDWESGPNGIVPNLPSQNAGLHCIPIIGFKKINGVDYLVVQNSYGPEIGDGGLFYFSEAVFNQFFTEPMYIFVPKGNVKPVAVGNWFQILIRNLCP